LLKVGLFSSIVKIIYNICTFAVLFVVKSDLYNARKECEISAASYFKELVTPAHKLKINQAN